MGMIKLQGEEIKVKGRDHLEYRGVNLFRVFYQDKQSYQWHFGPKLVYHFADLYMALHEIDLLIDEKGGVE